MVSALKVAQQTDSNNPQITNFSFFPENNIFSVFILELHDNNLFSLRNGYNRYLRRISGW